jgi:hypothetical protein
LCALLLDHDLSMGVEKSKLDVSQITRPCSEHWGWYKTVTMNLDRVVSFAGNVLPAGEQATLVGRAQRIRKTIEGAPKSLRWQTRARLGESMRWYDMPPVPTAEQRSVDIRYGD